MVIKDVIYIQDGHPMVILYLLILLMKIREKLLINVSEVLKKYE